MFLIRVADTKYQNILHITRFSLKIKPVCLFTFFFLLPVRGSRPLAVRGWSGLPLQPAADWLSWWWTGTDGPAASEPAGCDTWWDSPGESAPEGQE